MKKINFLLFLPILLIASCKDAGTKVQSSTGTNTVLAETPKTGKPAENSSAIKASNADEPAVAEIDVNGVKIKLHDLIKFSPKGNIILKTDNQKFDYYVMDVSLTNNTSQQVNSGKDFAFNIDIEAKDGTRFMTVDPSAKVASLYDMEVAKKDQAAYDKFWDKLQAGEKVRTILRGYEVPKKLVPAKLIYNNAGTGVKKEAPLK